MTALQNGVTAINDLSKRVGELEVGAQITSLSNRVNSGFFSVSLSSAQLTGGTTVVVNYTIEAFDTNNWFDTTTHKFTPTQSGYYHLFNQIYGTSVALAYIYKNGTAIRLGTWIDTATSQQVSLVSDIVFMNGTTDYIEFGAYSSSSIFATIETNAHGYRIGS